MINVAIVEDEKSAADLLWKYLERYGKENEITFCHTHYADAEQFLTDFHSQFDVVFMDIDMPYINGMDAARRLRKTDFTVALVFITNLSRYAIKGYEVEALDYILKPLNYEAFNLKIRKIINYCNRAFKNSITISFKGNQKRLYVDDIYYIEISSHEIVIHTANGEERSYGTLKEIKANLENSGFALCNRCYLVNLRHVKNIIGYSVAVGNEELTVSRPQKKEFISAWKSYISLHGGN